MNNNNYHHHHHLSHSFTIHQPPLLPSDKARKKDFPSVAKLLDGLSFQDETHPDFILRASRFKPNRHRSSPIEPPTLDVPSDIQPTNALLPRLSIRSSSPSCPSIPLLQTSCTTPPTTPLSPASTTHHFPSVPASPDHPPPLVSLKRPYNPSEQDDEDDDEQSDQESGRPTADPTFSLGIDWQAALTSQARRLPADPDRPLACPSRFWLNTLSPLERPITTPPPSSSSSSSAADRRTDKSQIAAESQLIGLMAARAIEIRQTDKRRRFIRGSRFHHHFIC